jgi:CheY-like chemotaxis protein
METLDGALLLVDDEPAVRKLLKMYLERSGIAVIDASSGEAAFEMFTREGSAVKFLITDLVMPGISGRELALQLRRLQPSLPILFISGYSDQLSDFPDDIPCLRKPLDLTRLIEEISCLLGMEPDLTAAN